MSSDTDFATQAQGGAVDEHAAMFGEGLGTEEAERYLGQELLPRFDRYVLQAEGGKAKFSREGTPAAHVGIRVLEGPEGTVNRVIFADLYLKVKQTKFEAGVEVPRTGEEYNAAIGELKKTLNKIARVFGLRRDFPRDFTEEGVAEYASQFGGQNGEGIKFIGAVSQRKATPDFDASNSLIWRSVATLDEPATDPKTKLPIKGKSSLDEAREALTKYEKKQASKNVGRTAGSLAGAPQRTIDPRVALA